jgi:hypothetical protein
MEKLKSTIEWLRMVVVSFLAGYMVYLAVATLYPVVISVFVHPHIMPSEIKAGEVAYYRNHYIRQYDCYGEVARIIVNDKGTQVAQDIKFLISPIGEHDVLTPIEIPRWLPMGTYSIQFYHRWYLSRPLLPVRIIEKKIESNNFKIVK